jgi:DNA-binding response OmpR family regulator
MDGWTVLQAVRLAGHEMPVLFLTARDQVEDRVRGLELGADDYLVKPFAFSELLAGCAPCCGAARARSRTYSRPRTWNSTCCGAG